MSAATPTTPATRQTPVADHAAHSALTSVHQTLTELVALTKGSAVNGVLESGTWVIPAGGVLTRDFTVPFGGVIVGNIDAAAPITLSPGYANSTAPREGVGVVVVGSGALVAHTIAGREFSVYGPVGARVYLVVTTKAPTPTAGMAVEVTDGAGADRVSLYGKSTAAGDTAVRVDSTGSVYMRGASVDTADAFAAPASAALATLAEGFAYNGVTWDRLRNASGAVLGRELTVAVGTVPVATLTAAAAIINGATIDYKVARRDLTVQLAGVFVATVRLQGSLNGVDWFDLAVINGSDTAAAPARLLDLTAPGVYSIPSTMPLRYVRANVTGYTSGTVGALVAAAG